MQMLSNSHVKYPIERNT